MTADGVRGSATTGEGLDGASHIGCGKSTVLCVDDDPDALEILQVFLSANGLTVVGASSAEEALRCVELRFPDLIITDCRMGRMSGLELCQSLRGQASSRRIPILLHTATPQPRHSPLYDGIFLKPANLQALVWAVRALIAASRVACRDSTAQP